MTIRGRMRTPEDHYEEQGQALADIQFANHNLKGQKVALHAEVERLWVKLMELGLDGKSHCSGYCTCEDEDYETQLSVVRRSLNVQYRDHEGRIADLESFLGPEMQRIQRAADMEANKANEEVAQFGDPEEEESAITDALERLGLL